MKALLILGMHRSGTSALAGQCASLGVWFGDNLLGPKPDNPKGFYESREVMQANDRLMTLLFGNWHSPITWADADRSFPLAHPRIEEIRQSLRARLEELAGSGRDIGIKDPRLSRLLPIWWPLVRSLAEPVLVMAIRSPTEVVASLEQRDSLGAATARLLWLRHVAEPLAYALDGGLQIAIVPYHQLIETPGIVADRLRSIGLQPQEQDGPPFAEAALRHHAGGAPGEGPLAKACEELYQAVVSIPVFGPDTVPAGTVALIQMARDLPLHPHLSLLYREAMGVSSERQRLVREKRMATHHERERAQRQRDAEADAVQSQA